jgi:hypothetical protein
MPRIRLTAQHVESLPAIDGKRTDYLDEIVTGLQLRVSPDGARSWCVRTQRGSGRAGRHNLRVTLGKTSRLSLAQARAEAREILERAQRGDVTPRPAALTVEDLVKRALAALHLADSTQKEWGRLLKAEISPAIGAHAAAELQRVDVRGWLREVGRRSHWN